MSKFNIGDRVIAICDFEGRKTKNKKGKIIDALDFAYDVAVEFDEAIEFCHSAAGRGKYGHCLYLKEDCLELIPKDNTKIVITTDGTETLARLYDGNKVIKSAVAKCSPDDTFDFGTGARIAFDRLMEDKKAHEYKAGDKVKVIANTCGHFCKIGETVTLTEIFYANKRGVNWCIKEHGGYIRDCDFIPYTAEEEKPLKFKIGDTVKVVNNGEGYTTYTEWFEKYSPDLLGEFVYGKKIPNGTKCVIEKINRHVWWSQKLYAVRPLGEYEAGIYLIGEDGIARA